VGSSASRQVPAVEGFKGDRVIHVECIVKTYGSAPPTDSITVASEDPTKVRLIVGGVMVIVAATDIIEAARNAINTARWG
jgi:hypothetical protein